MLNSFQRKLAEENERLIWYYLNSHHYNVDNSVQDYYGAAAIGLCRAAELYDTSMGVFFSSYAMAGIDFYVRSAYREIKEDSQYLNNYEDILDIKSIKCSDDLFSIESNLRYKELVKFINSVLDKSNFSDTNKQIIKHVLFADMSQVTAAKYFNTTKQNVNRVMRIFKDKFKEDYEQWLELENQTFRKTKTLY